MSIRFVTGRAFSYSKPHRLALCRTSVQRLGPDRSRSSANELAGGAGYECLSKGSDPLDPTAKTIALAKKARRGSAKTNTRRRAGKDHVTGQQGDDPRQMLDDLRNCEDHL